MNVRNYALVVVVIEVVVVVVIVVVIVVVVIVVVIVVVVIRILNACENHYNLTLKMTLNENNLAVLKTKQN